MGRAHLRIVAPAGLAAILVLAADQVTKSWAVDRLSRSDIHVVWTLSLVLQYNTGSAFGLARGWAPVVGGAAALIVVALVAAMRHVGSGTLAVALGMIVGGALGNLADRVFRSHHGGVVDFIALHWWPTFNVADASIVVGSLFAAYLLWRAGRYDHPGAEGGWE
jgi:signal peptidase II